MTFISLHQYEFELYLHLLYANIKSVSISTLLTGPIEGDILIFTESPAINFHCHTHSQETLYFYHL